MKRLIIVLSLILAILLSACIIFNCNHRLPYVECTDGFEYVDHYFEEIKMTKEEARKEIEKLFGNPKYIYKEKDCAKSHSIALFRIVVIKKKCSIDEYIMALTHELIHITEFTGNERYTEFRSFQVLYNCDNVQFNNVAGEIGNFAYYKMYDKNYQCWHYIYEYLKSEKTNR